VVIPHPLPEVNFKMVEIPTPKPYIFMVRVHRQIKCPKSWGLGSWPSPTGSFFENYTYLWDHFVNFNQTLPKWSLRDPPPKLFFSFLLIYKKKTNWFWLATRLLHLWCFLSLFFFIFLSFSSIIFKMWTVNHGVDCIDCCNTFHSTLCERLEGHCTYGCVECFK
jgi:hypothetical protein